MNDNMSLLEEIRMIFQPTMYIPPVAARDHVEDVTYQEVVCRLWVTDELYGQIAAYILDYAKVESETSGYYRSHCKMEEVSFAATGDVMLAVSGDVWLHYAIFREEWGEEEVLERVDIDLTATSFNCIDEEIANDFQAEQLKKHLK